MEFKDKCAICLVGMSRGAVVKLSPCGHLLHKGCQEGLEDDSLCPFCRARIEAASLMPRKQYKKIPARDRELVVQCANRGGDWVETASNLGINYKTAYNWVQSGCSETKKRGSARPRALTDGHVETLLSWIEHDCDITLKQMQQRLQRELNVTVSTSTIGNYLENQVYTLKKIHAEPINMNSNENKMKRKEYVEKLSKLIQDGKQVVWVDETNFNLFCRRTQGRAKRGKRAVQVQPTSQGPNVHLIGAISAGGVVIMERRRGSYNHELANLFIAKLIDQWEVTGNRVADLVIVLDNAPCHARVEQAVQETDAMILRLAPYSPMCNPIELFGRVSNQT